MTTTHPQPLKEKKYSQLNTVAVAIPRDNTVLNPVTLYFLWLYSRGEQMS